MTQPFRSGSGAYQSSVCPGVSIRLEEDHIVMQSIEPVTVLSKADSFVNWKVPLSYNCSDPVLDLGKMVERWGYSRASSIGLITAAKLSHASIMEANGDCFTMLCCTTAGTRNAARAGLNRPLFPAYSAGTINSFLFIDGRMTQSAMVNAVISATEAKTAALQDLGIMDSLHGLAATGTTTDSVVIAVSQSEHYNALHAYAGAATTIGDAICKLVYESVFESVRTQNDD
ncbi:adenosylcobinamide amidohydrolase [Paenibacillus solisilvae]|uniref:Adenosylcobinamide amidohydrolase n=1 Tax=Paenibacillus solisilvae TaxID=2486751 RepID=A0ABW0VUR0_9BACL